MWPWRCGSACMCTCRCSVPFRCPRCAWVLGGSSPPPSLSLSSCPLMEHTSFWSFCVFYQSTTLSHSTPPLSGHRRSQSVGETPCTRAWTGVLETWMARESWDWCWGLVGGPRRRGMDLLSPFHHYLHVMPSLLSRLWARVEWYVITCARSHVPQFGTRTHQRLSLSHLGRAARGRSWWHAHRPKSKERIKDGFHSPITIYLAAKNDSKMIFHKAGPISRQDIKRFQKINGTICEDWWWKYDDLETLCNWDWAISTDTSLHWGIPILLSNDCLGIT